MEKGRPGSTWWHIVPLLLLAACAGKPVVESDLHIPGAPEWVNKGTGVLKDRRGRLFHGVGSAPPMGDRSLQTETADNRARAELARTLTSYLEVVSSDYAAASGSGAGAAVDQGVSRQIDTLTRLNLTGSRIIARWRDEDSDVIYALAELDLERVNDTLRQVKTMDPGFLDYVRRHGGNVFDRMAERR
ncbi:MAG TPA: hypothetical protein ENK48_01720 [Gammaproteobacteria bacterium]|nr:hypothetical protein [Gammaproteobacteria bacterium]